MAQLKWWQRWHIPWLVLKWPLGAVLAAYSWIARRSSHEMVQGPGSTYDGPAVYVSWHEHISHLVPIHGSRRRWQLMSPAPYMEPILAWTTLLGLRSARSPIHQRMRESLGVLISALQRGGSVVIWVDGPTGPRRRAKQGCIEIAQQTNVPIIPVACWSRTNVRAWWRWDQALFPVPGDRVDVVFGDVIPVPQGVSPDSLLPQIDAALNALAPLEEGSLAKMKICRRGG